MNIAHALCQQAQRRPDAVALIETVGGKDRTLTFAQLDQSSARVAGLLRRKDVGPGDGVLVFVPMSIDLYVTLVALFRLGAVAVFLDPSAGHVHLQRCLSLAPPKAFIGTPRAHLLRWWAPALRKIPLKFVTRGWLPGAAPLWARGARPHAEVAPLDGDAPALLTFTSGSTGLPKACVRTHAFLRAQHAVLEGALAFEPGDVVASTLPIFVLAHLGSGVTSLIPTGDLRRPGAVKPGPIVRQLQARAASGLEASPAFLDCLWRHAQAEPFSLPALRRVLTGGAPVFPRLLAAVAGWAPGASRVAVYGSTEAEPIAELPAGELEAADLESMRGGAGLPAGVPVTAVALQILPDRFGTPLGPWTQEEFERQGLPPNEPGEIVVAGPHVLGGYLHGQGDEETKFRVGQRVWHRTGDAGYLDARGRLWLLGRCGARVQDARGTLYPFAVEAALSELDGLRRSALVAHRGRRLLAVTFDAPQPPERLAALKASLAWAHVDEVRPMDIPLDLRHNAKVDYPELRRRLEAA